MGSYGFAEKSFALAPVITISCVEVIHTVIDGILDHPRSLVFVDKLLRVEDVGGTLDSTLDGKPHAAEPQDRDLYPALSQCAVFHREPPKN
jgi:hypothetical protein